MRELQELPQADRSGQSKGRQVVLVHLIPRHKPAPLELGERAAHDLRGEALAAILHRRDDATDFPDAPMVLERKTHRARRLFLFQHASEGLAGRQEDA